MRMLRVGAAVMLGAAVLAGPVGAQSSVQVSSNGVTLSGRIAGPDGLGVNDVAIRARSGERQLETRTDSSGRWTLSGVAPGEWTLALRRIGFVADSIAVNVGDDALRIDHQLARAVTRIDGQTITATWVGVRGVVGDQRYQPIAGAVVEAIGRNAKASVSEEGTFAVPQGAGASVLLRVEAPGYEPRLVSARVPANGSIELSVLLDSLTGHEPNRIIAGDLNLRMGWASPMAAYITREEILEVGARDLSIAVAQSPSLQQRGLRLASDACLFVDGVARPGFPLASVMPEAVEFIEVYPGGADRSGVLARRWPPRGECGTSGGRGRSYVVVWTRSD